MQAVRLGGLQPMTTRDAREREWQRRRSDGRGAPAVAPMPGCWPGRMVKGCRPPQTRRAPRPPRGCAGVGRAAAGSRDLDPPVRRVGHSVHLFDHMPAVGVLSARGHLGARLWSLHLEEPARAFNEYHRPRGKRPGVLRPRGLAGSSCLRSGRSHKVSPIQAQRIQARRVALGL